MEKQAEDQELDDLLKIVQQSLGDKPPGLVTDMLPICNNVLSLGLRSGLVTSPAEMEAGEEKEVEEELQRVRRSRGGETSLWLLLIYERIYFKASSTRLDVTRLKAEGISEFLDRGSYSSIGAFSNDQPFEVRLPNYAWLMINIFRPLIETHVNKMIGMEFKGVYDELHTFDQCLTMMENSEAQRRYLQRIRKNSGDIPIELNEKIACMKLGYIPGQVQILLDLILTSSAMSTHFVSSILSGPFSNKSLREQVVRGNDLMQLVKVYFHEVPLRPRLRCLEDFLRIRETPSVKRWREVMHEFHREMRSGNQDGILKLKKEFSLASSDLGRAAKLEQSSGWATVLSVPVAVVEALVGLPPIAGITVAVLGSAFSVSASRRRLMNSWVALGNETLKNFD